MFGVSSKPDVNRIQSRDDLLEAHEDIKGSTPLMNTDQPIIKEGWLQKQSKYLQQYRKRWIVLQPNHIYSYKKKQQYKYHTEDIDLRKVNININNMQNNEKEKEHDNEHKNENGNLNNNEFIIDEYRFIANSKHDANEWILSIKNWLNFSRDIRDYRKKWKRIIYDRTVKRMEFESLNIINCISLHECECSKRIIFILSFYRIWCTKHFIASEWIGISIESIIKHEFGFSSYNTIQLINDFNHLLKGHYYKNKTHFFNFFINALGMCGKHRNKCFIYLRNNRNKYKIDQDMNCNSDIYFKYSKSSDIITQQLLDKFHCFISHNFDKEQRQEKKQQFEEHINGHEHGFGNELTTLLMSKQDNQRHKKYNTIINNNKCKNNSVFGENFSYWHCDNRRSNYVTAKFHSLKQEMLYNSIYCLNLNEWNIIREKAMKYKYCLFGRAMIANNISQWNKRAEIKSETPISIKHIIVLLLNTNYTNLSILFKKQTQKLIVNETVFHLKKRNQIIAHFCKLLFECVYLFGNVMYCDQLYYHNINKPLLFNSFPMLSFKSPISVTINKKRLYNINQNDNNILLQLKPYSDATMPYFNVNWLTDFIDEDERLLFRIHLNINNIFIHNILNNNQKNSHDEMLAFKLFIAISDGKFVTHCNDLMHINTQNILNKMLMQFEKKEQEVKEEEEKEDISYVNKLFDYYIKNKKEYWLNEMECARLDQKLYETFMSYLKNINPKNRNKIQLFSWYLDLKNNDIGNNNNNMKSFNGPTLLYTLNNNNINENNDSFQIAFDSFLIVQNKQNDKYSTFYFSLSSMPINLKRITVSFYLFCVENNFYAQIEHNKMSIYNNSNGMNGIKQIGYRCFNIYDLTNNKNRKITWKIAVKVLDIQLTN